jgi:hypothetical protein
MPAVFVCATRKSVHNELLVLILAANKRLASTKMEMIKIMGD